MKVRHTAVRFARRLGRAAHGASAIEMAVVFPLLISLLIGFAEFGRLLYHQQVVEKSVRDAVRYLTRIPLDLGAGEDFEGDPSTCTGTSTEPICVARHFAIYGASTDTDDPLVPYWEDGSGSPRYDTIAITGPTDVDVDDPGNPGTTLTTVPVVTMTVSLVYGDLGLFGAIGLSNDLNITVTHRERYIGE